MTTNFKVTNTNGIGSLDLDQLYATQSTFVSGNQFGWGQGGGGQLGTGTGANQTLGPARSTDAADVWKMGAAGTGHLARIRVNGTLWMCGYHYAGSLGNGQSSFATSTSIPFQLGNLTWQYVACSKGTGPSNDCTMAITSDGRLYGWGDNSSGKLGLGDTAGRSTPIQVGLLADWKQVSCGILTTHAVKNDGTLWGWGAGSIIGGGNVLDRSSPVQLGSSTNWRQVDVGSSHVLAVRTDGTLWTWGSSTNGALGQNVASTNVSSPIQIGSATNWKRAAAGADSSFAITTDGKLFSWGANTAGQLGQGNTVNQSSPTQIGSLTTWKFLSISNNFANAVTTDGKLFSWGQNDTGQVGDGSTTNRSSPVQIGSPKGWMYCWVNGPSSSGAIQG